MLLLSESSIKIHATMMGALLTFLVASSTPAAVVAQASSAQRVSAKSLALVDTELQSEIENIDTLQDADCDPNTATAEPEPFGNIKFQVTLENNLLESVSVRSYRVKVSGFATSRRFPMSSSSEIAPGASETVEGYLALAGSGRKRLIGEASDIPTEAAVRRITLTLNVVRASGKRAQIRLRVARPFSDNDNCQ